MALPPVQHSDSAAASAGPVVCAGIGASPGVVVGRVHRVRHDRLLLVERSPDTAGERRRFEDAAGRARLDLRSLQDRLLQEGREIEAGIFAAQEALLDDPALLREVTATIAEGWTAAFSWHRAIQLHADRLASLDDGTLASRATDLRDLGRRVVRLITGTGAARIVAPPGAIVVADDLTPSEAATLDRGMVLGFCTRGGGPTSHVAILARALGVPAVVAIDPRALDLADGTEAILDGAAGTLTSRPSGAQVSVAQARHQRDLARRTDDIERSSHPAVTLDGHRLQVLGNVGTQGEVEGLLAYGGDGVGLLRSEFLFVGRDRAPSEDEQASAYGAMAGVLGASRPLVVRTLDAGGDTPLDFVEVPRETNPSLGERGIRLGFEHPGLLRSQVRAVLRASAHGMVRVMFPMVARLAEWRAARALLEEEARAMGLPLVPAGIMVEVPAAALLADAFAREVDFFSLGTNDLAQYTLAMDRGHPMLAAQVDGLEPAVLQLIARTVEAARRHGRRVAVCGELAADPQAVPVLVGMGVDELSVGVAAIPEVKAMIRTLERRACEVLASRALAAGSAAEVRGLSPALRA